MTTKKTDFTKKAPKAEAIDLKTDIIAKESAPTATSKPTVKKVESLNNRYTARFNDTEWAYLQEKHWQTRTSMTDIIRDLVKADMKKNPDIVAQIDELNN